MTGIEGLVGSILTQLVRGEGPCCLGPFTRSKIDNVLARLQDALESKDIIVIAEDNSIYCIPLYTITTLPVLDSEREALEAP